MLVGALGGLLRAVAWVAGFVVAARIHARAPRAASWLFAGSALGLFGTAVGALQGVVLPLLGFGMGGDVLSSVYAVVFLVLGVLDAAAVACLVAGAAFAVDPAPAP